MQTEYEATFLDIDKDDMRERLKNAGAKLERPEFKQRRVVLCSPLEENARYVWMRVRDEGDKITMTWKSVTGKAIDEQKEVEVTVDNFDNAIELLEKIGCVAQSYQESLREIWTLDGVEIVIDTWPFLEPLVEIEGASEEDVRTATDALGFSWENAHFESAGAFYRTKYGPNANISELPRLTFEMQNPFA